MPDAAVLRAWIVEEQACLWARLGNEIRHAANGVYSIAVESTAARIVSADRLVGPLPAGEIPWQMLAGGIYETVLHLGGFRAGDGVTDEQWAEWDVGMSQHGGTRAELRQRFAATRVRLLSEHEVIAP